MMAATAWVASIGARRPLSRRGLGVAVVVTALQGAATHAACPTGLPIASVGRLEADTGERCIGTAVANDIVVAPAHCLFTREGAAIPARAVVFRTRDGTAHSVLLILRHADFSTSAGATARSISVDLSLLVLESGLAQAAPLRTGGWISQGQLVLVDDMRSEGRSCRIASPVGDLFELDCRLSPGDSGAPVFAVTGCGGVSLVGLVSAIESKDDANTGIVKRLPDRIIEAWGPQ